MELPKVLTREDAMQFLVALGASIIHEDGVTAPAVADLADEIGKLMDGKKFYLAMSAMVLALYSGFKDGMHPTNSIPTH